MKTKAPQRRPERPAFTLAEVMIALGIVATVMVGMLAAIPQALTSIRESTNLTVMGRIAQEVISDIQMSEWDDIEKNYRGKSFKYDNEGLTFEGREGQTPTYEARVDLKQERVSLGSNLEYHTDLMRKVQVEVEFTPGGSYNKDEQIRRRNTQRFIVPVANQNQIEIK